MGIAKKQRKKRVFHKKRWDKVTIEEDKKLVKEYAMKNKKEIRKFELYLKNIKEQAKEFNRHRITGLPQEAKDFINRQYLMGFLTTPEAELDDVLSISLRDLLDRRLSSIVYKKKMAQSPQQARQLIVHGHVEYNGQKITSPNILIPLEKEEQIDFFQKSPLASEEHPLRKEEVQGVIEEEEQIKESEKRSPQEEAEDFDTKEQELEDQEADEMKEE